MKKLLAILLCLLLLFSAVPMSVFAYENVTNLETVSGTVNRDRFEKLGAGFNALSNTDVKDSNIMQHSILNHDGVEALLLSTSDTHAEAKFATSAEELMLAFGIDYTKTTDVTVPIKVATVGVGTKFGISADLKYENVTESMYYYYIQETITNKLSLYLPEKKMDNPTEIVSEDFLYALERLAADDSDENIAAFYNTWGTHILVSYNKGAALEYVASSHITDMRASLDANISSKLSASVGVGKVKVEDMQEIAADVSAAYKNKEVNLNHKWYAVGGDSNLVNGSSASADDTEEMNDSINAWSASIGTNGVYNSVLIPQSTQWKAIWEFVPNEFADLKVSLQNYYKSKATGVNAAFFEQFTTYGVSGATNTYYTSVAKDANGNNLIFKMPTNDNFAVAPGSRVNIVNMGTDLRNYEAVVTPASYATVDENGVVTFAADAKGGSKITIQLKERRADGTLGSSARVTANYTIQTEGADGKFAGGYGDAARPYLIATPLQFSNIRNANTETTHFRLIQDINNFGTFEPLPAFTGTFDGNNYTLTGGRYTISAAGTYGLFKTISSGATVKNVILKDFYINSTNKENITGRLHVGLLCGENKGTVENVHIHYGRVDVSMGSTSKSVDNYMQAGLLCGRSSGTITRCGVSSVSGKSSVKAVCDVGVGGSSTNDLAEVCVGAIVGFACNGTIADIYVHDCIITGGAHSTTEKKINFWGNKVCDNHGRPKVYAGGAFGSFKDTDVSRVVAYDNDLSGCYSTLANHDCDWAVITKEVGIISGFAEKPSSTSEKTTMTNCYGESGEGSLISLNDINTTGAKALSSLKAQNLISTLVGFDKEWYQPGNTGHMSIAQYATVSVNDAYLQREYFVGEALNYGGIEIKPVKEGFTDPLDTLLNGFTISGYDPSKVGTQTITVTYGKVKDTYTVTVKEPVVTSLSIITQPNQTLFYEGEEIDYTGLSVMAFKDDGSSENVALNDLEFSADEMENDSKKIIVAYAGCTAEFVIRICPVVATNMEIVTLADKTAFAVGENFSAAGLTLELIYNNGTKQTLTAQDVAIVTPDMSSYGPKAVTITYGEFVCTYEIVIEGCVHKETITVSAVAPTCTSEGCGEYVVCTYCETILVGSKTPLPMLDHEYDNACDADCNACGGVRVPAAHVYDNACDADCNVCGLFRQASDHIYNNACDADCNACGGVRVPAAHVYDNACDADCNTCGALRQVADHVYVGKVTLEPTCTDDGIKTYTCYVCSNSYVELIPAVGHAYHAVVTAPTCEREGYTTYTCTNCEDSYVDEYTDPVGHSAVAIPGKDPTCTQDGLTEGSKCSACGEVLKPQEIIYATGEHEYFFQVTTPATCGADGVRTYTCTGCTNGYTEVIPATGEHVYDDEKDAECNGCGQVRPVAPSLPEDAPAFVMDNVSAAAGETFTMAIRTERNSGIVSFKLNLTYDPDALELISVEEKDFIGMSFSPMGNPFIINWVDALRPNNTTNGVVLLVTFRVKEDAPTGVSDITLSYDPEDVYDQNFDNVAFRTENGSVKIVDYIPGDVNSDGKVNNKDLGRLQQYVNGWDVSISASAADVNGDGKVNNKDLGRLQQYVNGWDVELG